MMGPVAAQIQARARSKLAALEASTEEYKTKVASDSTHSVFETKLSVYSGSRGGYLGLRF